MTIINWDKPKKLRSTEKHNNMCSSDCGVPGTYVPNMSYEDRESWKGKHINKTKNNERIELRKTFSRCGSYAQVLIVLEKEGTVSISSNGKIAMTFDDWDEVNAVVKEALDLINV